MKESLTPEKIQEALTIGDLSKENAAELLISLIERSDNTKIRVASIKALEKIEFQTKKIFKTIENCLISDENAVVRSSVTKHIIHNFPEEGLPALRWAIQHDKSPLVLKVFFDSIEKFDNPQLKQIKKDLSNWNEQYASKIGLIPEESRFFLDLEVLFAKDRKNYEIEPNNYKIFQELRNTRNSEPWLVINNNHVEILNFNYFNWKFINENREIIPSLFKLNYLYLYFEIIRKYSSYHNFSRIPESIGALTCLKKLILARNKLQKIPDSIGKLTSLKVLDLSFNELREIPQIIRSINSLEELNLNNNRIEHIPNSMKPFLKTLKNFYV